MDNNQDNLLEEQRKRLQNREFFLQVVSMVITIAVAVLGIYLVLYFTGNTSSETPENNLPVGTTTPAVVQPSQYPDYDNLNELIAEPLVSATTSSQGSRPIKPITINLEVKGKFSRVYLYTETSVNNKPLTDWDSLYIGFRFSNFPLNGINGHLFRPGSLPVPQDNKTTRLLFNTSAVQYIQLPYSASKIPNTLDWFNNTFNSSAYQSENPRKVYFDTFISTTQTGTIHLIALYYSCAEDSPECYIKVQ